jgi:Putative adhesin
VATCAAIVVGAAAVLLVLDLTSREERVASYPVRGTLDGLAFDLGDADITIAGGGARAGVAVQHTDRFAFGHGARVVRSSADGIFRVRSRCPRTVMHSCSVRYRVTVPDNLPVDVRTSGGDVRFDNYRGSARVATDRGDIDVSGFCGFSLVARAESGDVDAGAACAPQQLSLRSTTGSVHAEVPPGSYQVEAESASGSRTVRGIASAQGAPFSIQALSSAGDVLVEARR